MPDAQVSCRRKEAFIANCAVLAESLSIRLSAESAKQFLLEILAAEDLAKEDPNISRLLKAVFAKLDDAALEEVEAAILRGFLLKGAQGAIADTTKSFANKMLYVEPVFLAIKELGDRATVSFVDDAATTFLSLLFSDHSDVVIPPLVAEAFRSQRISES